MLKTSIADSSDPNWTAYGFKAKLKICLCNVAFSGKTPKTRVQERLSKKSKRGVPVILASLKINNLQTRKNPQMARFRVFRQSRKEHSIWHPLNPLQIGIHGIRIYGFNILRLKLSIDNSRGYALHLL
jgi:hypothetical protein